MPVRLERKLSAILINWKWTGTMRYAIRCGDCQLLDGTLQRIVLLLDKQKKEVDCDQFALLNEDFKRNSECIFNWKRHQLRAVHQDLARDYILEQLDDSNVFIVIDWAMKWVEAKYREKQSEWYGKKGLPSHVIIKRTLDADRCVLLHLAAFERDPTIKTDFERR